MDDDDVSAQPGSHSDAVLHQLNPRQSLVFAQRDPIFLPAMAGVQVQEAESVFLEPAADRFNLRV